MPPWSWHTWSAVLWLAVPELHMFAVSVPPAAVHIFSELTVTELAHAPSRRPARIVAPERTSAVLGLIYCLSPGLWKTAHRLDLGDPRLDHPVVFTALHLSARLRGAGDETDHDAGRDDG